MVHGGMTVVKYLLFIFNFVFFLSGIGIIIIGFLVQSELSKYDTVLDGESYTASAVFFIIIGFIVTVIAFFGCCGAIKENHCMIITFAVFLGIIFILELAAGITGFVYRGKMDDIALGSVTKTWEKYGIDGNDQLTQSIDIIQHDLECCGVNGSSDWAVFPWGKNTSNLDSVPDSCCKEENENCGKGKLIDQKGIYTKGCYDVLRESMKDDILVIAGVGVGVAFIQLVGIVFACCLAGAIRRNYEMV